MLSTFQHGKHSETAELRMQIIFESMNSNKENYIIFGFCASKYIKTLKKKKKKSKNHNIPKLRLNKKKKKEHFLFQMIHY